MMTFRPLSLLARVALLLVSALGLSSPASAQTLYGTLLGNVTDDTGLAVPGAR